MQTSLGGFGCRFGVVFFNIRKLVRKISKHAAVFLSGADSLQTLVYDNLSVECGTKDGRTLAKMSKLLKCCKQLQSSQQELNFTLC